MKVMVELDLVPVDCREYIVDSICDPEVLDKLVDTYTTAGIRTRIAMKLGLLEKTFEKLAKDPDAQIRRLVAENPQASADALEILSNNKEWYIKYSVAVNPNTSNETISKLENDEDDRVRKKAKERMMF